MSACLVTTVAYALAAKMTSIALSVQYVVVLLHRWIKYISVKAMTMYKIAFGARSSAHGLLSCTTLALWMLGGTVFSPQSSCNYAYVSVVVCQNRLWVNVDPLWVALMPKSKKILYRRTPQLKLFRLSSWMMLWIFVYRQANITYDFSVGVSCCHVLCSSKLAEMNQKVLGTAPGVSKSSGAPINL